MAQLQAPLDTTGIDTSSDFTTLPEGWYQAVIVDSDESENSKGNGRFIKLEFVIGSGKYSGTKILHWLNYQHSTAKAQEIGLRELTKIMQIAGVPSPLRDTMQLHNKKMEIEIKPDGTYNRVTGVRAIAATQADLYRPAQAPAPTDPDFDDDVPF